MHSTAGHTSPQVNHAKNLANFKIPLVMPSPLFTIINCGAGFATTDLSAKVHNLVQRCLYHDDCLYILQEVSEKLVKSIQAELTSVTQRPVLFCVSPVARKMRMAFLWFADTYTKLMDPVLLESMGVAKKFFGGPIPASVRDLFDAKVGRPPFVGAFRDLRNGKDFFAFNVHMLCTGERNTLYRVRQAFFAFLELWTPQVPCVVAGDFNWSCSKLNSSTYRELLSMKMDSVKNLWFVRMSGDDGFFVSGSHAALESRLDLVVDPNVRTLVEQQALAALGGPARATQKQINYMVKCLYTDHNSVGLVARSVVAVPQPVLHVVAATQPVSHVVTAPQPVSHVVAAPQPVPQVVAAPQPVSHVVAVAVPVSHVVAVAVPVSHVVAAPVTVPHVVYVPVPHVVYVPVPHVVYVPQPVPQVLCVNVSGVEDMDVDDF